MLASVEFQHGKKGTSFLDGNPERSIGQGSRMVQGSLRATEVAAYEGLVSQGFLSQTDLQLAVEEANTAIVGLEGLLLNKYRISKPALGKVLSEYYDCPYVPYDERTVVAPGLFKTLNIDYLRHHYWLPLRRDGNILDVIIDNPRDLERRLDIRRAFPGMTHRLAVGLRSDIDQFLQAAIGRASAESLNDILGELVSETQIEQREEAILAGVNENDSAIVRLANQIIVEANRLGASDIHIEPYSDRKETAVRLRVDGTCFTYMRIPAAYRRAIVSRIKIMANLDIAEQRKPQDGKIRFKLSANKEIELRVATLPTAGSNEDVVMRLLTAQGPMPLEAMEFTPRTLQTLKELSEKPYGIILCVGPTGSGKTTTLHALLGHINTSERKIWTAEDPIEITQEGLRQVQVHSKIGFNFAAAMRAFLRADPDVIMIGEMRDKETADIAIEASLTGHLVLSTLHTNSAVETVVRLLDLGCDSFNFADAMLGVLAKRLCKRICPECKEAYHPTLQEYEDLVRAYGATDWEQCGIQCSKDFQLYRGRGCGACNQTGFKGRVALHELLLGSEDMKNLIQSRGRTAEMLSLARKEGMATLLQDGIDKVLQGATTFKQVRAVAMK